MQQIEVSSSDQRILLTHDEKPTTPNPNALQHKSSSKVNSLYLNNINGSQSIQSSNRLVDDESSSRSMPKTTDIATISGTQLLAMCSGIDVIPME